MARSTAASSSPNLVSNLIALSPPRLFAHRYVTWLAAWVPPLALATCLIYKGACMYTQLIDVFNNENNSVRG